MNNSTTLNALSCCASNVCGADCDLYGTDKCRMVLYRNTLVLVRDIASENLRGKITDDMIGDERDHFIDILNYAIQHVNRWIG